jgi:putative addiction module killer protein
MERNFELRRYRTPSGRVPYSDWLRSLDNTPAARVEAHVDRMKTGNFGDSRPVGSGVIELRIHTGPGYRVYYVHDDGRIVVLLCGGTKGSQAADIRKAQDHARDYWERR